MMPRKRAPDEPPPRFRETPPRSRRAKALLPTAEHDLGIEIHGLPQEQQYLILRGYLSRTIGAAAREMGITLPEALVWEETLRSRILDLRHAETDTILEALKLMKGQQIEHLGKMFLDLVEHWRTNSTVLMAQMEPRDVVRSVLALSEKLSPPPPEKDSRAQDIESVARQAAAETMRGVFEVARALREGRAVALRDGQVEIVDAPPETKPKRSVKKKG